MKNYVNAEIEIFKLDAGEIMLSSFDIFSFDSFETEDPNDKTSKHYNNWGNWNS